MFASQSFEGDTAPEDMDPEALYSKFPRLCAGIVVFDILIGNRDRGLWNIHVDSPASPRIVRLYDHERALFYVYPQEGIDQLRSREQRLGITQSSTSNNHSHCLIGRVKSHEDISHWIDRVRGLPDWLIDAICREVKPFALTEPECAAVITFLKTRRDTLGELILKHKSRFSSVNTWPLFL